MSRSISTAFKDVVTSKVVYPVILVETEFDSGSINMWSGLGTLSVGGKDYLGGGEVLRVDPGEETAAIEARGAVFELSGVKESDISIALQENYQGRPARILFGSFNGDGEVIADPVRLFSGRMDVMTINDDPSHPVITMTAENDMIRLNRTRERRFTHEDQQIDYPGDMFFEFVAAMQDREIIWG